MGLRRLEKQNRKVPSESIRMVFSKQGFLLNPKIPQRRGGQSKNSTRLPIVVNVPKTVKMGKDGVIHLRSPLGIGGM